MLELDDDRVKKWDRAADDMIATKVIVIGIQENVEEVKKNGHKTNEHLERTNGDVADIKGEQLIMRGMMIATMAIVTIGGTVTGIVVALARVGG